LLNSYRITAKKVKATNTELTEQLKEATENPMVRLKELPDDRDLCYVWLLKADHNTSEFAQSITNYYIQHKGHEPKALHIVVHEVKDISLFTKREVALQITPHLRGEE